MIDTNKKELEKFKRAIPKIKEYIQEKKLKNEKIIITISEAGVFYQREKRNWWF